MMKNIFISNRQFIIILCVLITAFTSCMSDGFEKEKYGNCSDGIKNQREEAVDCGGPCMPCASCDDGQTNATETGIDCGGVCQSCERGCSIPAGTIEYTLYPQEFPSGFDNSQNLSGSAMYSA